MTVFKLTIEYDGSAFSGWQYQPNVRTVQGVIEQALETMLRQKVRIQGAGRTDAGVHALGQVASFEADTELLPARLQKGISALARPEVAVVDAAIAPPGFNARFDSTGKHYQYQILSRSTPSPMRRHTSYFVPQPLDIDLMQKAGQYLIGEHDFKGFRASDCERKKTVTRLSLVSVRKEESGLIAIDIEGVAFMKNMVRIIAGTLLEIGRKRLEPEIIQTLFDTGDRTLAGPTAPAQGLTLVKVFYPEGWIRER